MQELRDKAEFHFLSAERTPYIRELFNYTLDESEGEGSIHFNGYYYVNDTPDQQEYSISLPQKLMMFLIRYSDTKETENTENTDTYKRIGENMYEIEIYKRVVEEDTSVYGPVDDDGEEISVCFFPTNKQTLYFRILRTLKEGEEIPSAYYGR